MSTKTENDTEQSNPTESLWETYDDLPNGAQAELRRGTPSEPFWRMLASVGKEREPDPEKLSKWRLLIQCMAIAGYSGTPFGLALKKAEYSEARLKRLLEADDEQLSTLLRRTAKQLKSADQKANWNTIRRLLFDEEETEEVRLQIAQEYYTYDTNLNQDDSADE
ncbi:type I-E CRISPR-associated protein Cse2/CasB [Salinibacter sp.]|uniref:type I-E CRISPR-associated protein Cse2/CasB n=1 Tax=Salinibacter sp. TaxID=2065818 RepID=UPI0021E9ADCD|nr:type I-E CRISPR-associated protein Cse2/CasB [Salinibacter sp.]